MEFRYEREITRNKNGVKRKRSERAACRPVLRASEYGVIRDQCCLDPEADFFRDICLPTSHGMEPIRGPIARCIIGL
jgi:hypothetical protein